MDLARDLIRLSGFEPEVDILRPGEKLFKELITQDFKPRIMSRDLCIAGPMGE